MTASTSWKWTYWMSFLWGPVIWFTHFGLVYLFASLGLVLVGEATALWRWAIAVSTVAIVASCVVGWLWAERYAPGSPGSDLHQFWIMGTKLLDGLSALAVVWQALPALMIP